jgi:hypothetical protein
VSEPDDPLSAAAPALWAALSPLGRRLRMPANFLPQQTADARGKPFNATIGQITDGRNRAMPLPPIREAVGGLAAELADRALLYSPVEGFADLRARWRERQRRGRPEEPASSLPLVTAGPAMALALAAELFLAPGRDVLLPQEAPDSYAEIFCLRTGARAMRIPCGPHGLPVSGPLAAALADGPAGEPVLIAVRCPLVAGGPAPRPEARADLRDVLLDAAEKRPVVVVLDDVWHGGAEVAGGSLFWDLAGRHPPLIALRVEGADALEFGGGRVGFLTLPYEPGTEVAQALEDKVKLLARAVIGSPPATSQAVLLHALSV